MSGSIDHADDFDTRYAEVSRVLLEFGSMVSPYILGGEFEALVKACDEVRANPPTSDEQRAKVELALDECLTNAVYNPNYRAFNVYRMSVLPHVGDFSHMLEQATFHYYKREFLSCVLCLLPAVEGSLRSYVGGPLKFGEYAARLQSGIAETYPERHKLYGHALAGFIGKWFFTPTKEADFTLSHLNRHYIAHGLGTKSFYRATDCHRLFLFFDLFADLLMLEGHGEKYVFIPDDVPQLERRREYYDLLIRAPIVLSAAREMEESLLREHRCYVPEKTPPEFEKIFARWVEIMGLRNAPQPFQNATRTQEKPNGVVARVVRAATRIARGHR